MSEIITSLYHDIQVHLTGWDEPNNGRMLRVAELYINGENQTEKYFEGWNRLDEILSAWIPDSPDGKYFFIPAEGGGFLIDTQSYVKIPLPYKGLSTITFKGNQYEGQILILIHSDETIRFNLEDHSFERPIEK